jgi:mannose-1-phosphate guanylyltransferase
MTDPFTRLRRSDEAVAPDPAFAAALRRIAADRSLLEELWPTLPKIALDHAVAEPAAAAGRVATVPSSFGWDDIGDFDSLATMLEADGDPDSLTVLGDPALVHALGSTGLVVPGAGRVVAVIGLDDIVVVDTPDAVLVTSRSLAQDVKAVVAALKESGRADLT